MADVRQRPQGRRARADAECVLIGVLVLLALAAVPLAGGSLSRLIRLRISRARVAVAALAVQILVVNIVPGGSHALHAGVVIATYAVLASVLVANAWTRGVGL